jgi:Ca2+-binding RTX toxin-like protein
LGTTLGVTGTAQATDYIVDDLGNSGPGTLRQAVLDANLNFGPDRILFQSGLSGTIHLSFPQLDIYDPVEILGPGPGTLAVTQDGTGRIAYVHPGDGESVTISGLTLTEGAGPGDVNHGGVIWTGGVSSESNLTISNSVLSGSEASGNGGAIYVYKGSLQVESSTISGNTAGSAGGGIYFYDTDDATQSTIRNSTISGNTVSAGGYEDGGALYLTVSNDQGPLLIENSTLSNNTVPDRGGAIWDDAGGGPLTTIVSSTIAGNSAGNDGGGIASFYGATLQNTIVANNSAGDQGPDLWSDDAFAIFNTAFSLIEDTSGATINETVAGSNIFGQDPQLGALASNGGPTQTMALPQTSPTVDKGSSGSGIDQRGSPRPSDFSTIPNSAAAGANGADIGAFELTAPAAAAAPKCKGKTATVFRDGHSRTLTGTNKRDVVVGTSKKDRINTKGGNDLVCAKGGKDTVKGKGGKDKLLGQGGKDTLKGGAGKDTLKGGAGKDRLFGQGGKDKLVGGAKNDTCVGGAGNDTEKSC